MQLPREVIVGKGIIDRVIEVLGRLGLMRSALIVTGSKTYSIAGQVVEGLLIDEDIEVKKFLVQSTTVEEVEAVEKKIKELKPQVVFGVGGGTKIDIAKLGSANQGIPFISIPTTASHDGIASPFSSVKGSEQPYSVMAQAPIAILADTDIIMQAPQRYFISGCGDVIAKFTSVKDWKLAHEKKDEYYGDYAASLALMSAKLVMKNIESIHSQEEEGVRILLEALISCGVAMSIAGSSRPCSGSEHLFSHALDMIQPNQALHGEQCGVGTIMMAYLHNEDWEHIKSTLSILGAPTNAQQLGVDKKDVIEALELSSNIRSERYTILNDLDLNRQGYEEMARATGVI